MPFKKLSAQLRSALKFYDIAETIDMGDIRVDLRDRDTWYGIAGDFRGIEKSWKDGPPIYTIEVADRLDLLSDYDNEDVV